MQISKINYFIGKNIQEAIIGLINFKFKILRFIPNGLYLSLDLKRTGESIDTIFDVGANVGQSCVAFHKSFPMSKIYSFEPVEPIFNALAVNARNYPSITAVNLALGEKKEILNIDLQDYSEINSLKRRIDEHNNNHATVTVETGANFCRLNGVTAISLLKIDTEGYELEVLKGFDKEFLTNSVKFIYAEVCFDRRDNLKTYYADIDAYLSPLGFVTSGFYEAGRWGKNKLKLGFCNALFTNITMVKN